MGLFKPDYTEAESALWATTHESASAEARDGLLMQQYIQYLEMADRISERRNTANAFFLTLNTGIIAAFATFSESGKSPDENIMTAALIALISLCVCWMWLIRSYRTLNRAKFNVAAMMEKHLPAAPFDAEWVALGKSKNWLIHAPLTPIETLVPLIFIVIYGAALSLP